MDAPTKDVAFTGDIAEIYETHFVPLLFAPYAEDLAHRAVGCRPSRVLEIAAGTGAVTRVLARSLPPDVEIVATDLNQAMIDKAAAVGTSRPVTWRAADAMHLPFPDASFDLVLCQFGAMFFPDRGHAFAEARRVLRDGGHLLFNVWDGLADNELAATVLTVLATLFPDDPPRFMERIPHGYHDVAQIEADLVRGGFTKTPSIETVAMRSRTDSARTAALAYVQGTPIRNEIEARDPARLAEVTANAERTIATKYGAGPIDAKMQAKIVLVAR